jgi:hypothetical protein
MNIKILTRFLFILTTLMALESHAQEYVPFPVSNAIWSEVFTDLQPSIINPYRYGIDGDTIINELQYSKLFLLNDTVFPLSIGQYCGAIREDSLKRIFITDCNCAFPYIEENEVILYDFSKSIGDTVFVGLEGYGSAGYLIISEIDSVLVESNYRKRFSFMFDEEKWTEGIGSTRGLLSPIQIQPLGMEKWELICFKQDGIVKYLNPDFNTCFPLLTDLNDQNHVFELTIHPNPVSDISYIKLEQRMTGYQLIEIFDILGKLKKTIDIPPGSTQIEIRNQEFESGIYLLILRGDSKKSLSSKILFTKN